MLFFIMSDSEHTEISKVFTEMHVIYNYLVISKVYEVTYT